MNNLNNFQESINYYNELISIDIKLRDVDYFIVLFSTIKEIKEKYNGLSIKERREAKNLFDISILCERYLKKIGEDYKKKLN